MLENICKIELHLLFAKTVKMKNQVLLYEAPFSAPRPPHAASRLSRFTIVSGMYRKETSADFLAILNFLLTEQECYDSL